MSAPTLINLPPPPSDPVTPSDVPSRSGTPNSTTTSMSELSTVAIKDGHRGHLPHHHHSLGGNAPASGLSNQLDAERADRISRLAGLERVTTARANNPMSTPQNLTPGAAAPPQQGPGPHSYFDSTGNPAIGRERSTVGSASATGSVGARTTWAGSEAGDMDKLSESQTENDDIDMESVGPSEEDNASLVGFGEGARTPARASVISNPGGGGKGATPTTAREAKMIDGMTYDPNVVDTTADGSMPRRTPYVFGSGAGVSTDGAAQQAERIVRDHMDVTSNDRMRGNAQVGDLGKFGFEK